MARPDNIREIGLERFLNDTRQKHRGLGYDAFCAMVEGEASVSSMARSFKVTFRTMDKWLAIHREESLRRVSSAKK